MAVCQNLVPLVNIKIAGKWMFIPLKMVLIGIDPHPNHSTGWDWMTFPLGSPTGNAPLVYPFKVHERMRSLEWDAPFFLGGGIWATQCHNYHGDALYILLFIPPICGGIPLGSPQYTMEKIGKMLGLNSLRASHISLIFGNGLLLVEMTHHPNRSGRPFRP